MYNYFCLKAVTNLSRKIYLPLYGRNVFWVTIFYKYHASDVYVYVCLPLCYSGISLTNQNLAYAPGVADPTFYKVGNVINFQDYCKEKRWKIITFYKNMKKNAIIQWSTSQYLFCFFTNFIEWLWIFSYESCLHQPEVSWSKLSKCDSRSNTKKLLNY